MINGSNHSTGIFPRNSGKWNEMLYSALRRNKSLFPMVGLGVSFQHNSAFVMKKKLRIRSQMF